MEQNSMGHCLENKGNFVFRIRRNAFDIYDKKGNKMDLIKKLKGKTSR